MAETGKHYDLFLSHHTADKPVVRRIAQRLVEAGFQVFLDEWELVPGELWQKHLEEALMTSRTCAVLVGPHGFGRWHAVEMRTAFDLQLQQRSRVVPVLLPGATEESVPLFLRQLSWIDFRQGLQNEEVWRRLTAWVRHQEAPGPDPSPSEAACRSMASPPSGFIDRREMGRLVDLLCESTTDDGAASTVAITAALRGAGGFGKTTMAQAVAFDPRIRRAYPAAVACYCYHAPGPTAVVGDALGRVHLIDMFLPGEIQTSPSAF